MDELDEDIKATPLDFQLTHAAGIIDRQGRVYDFLIGRRNGLANPKQTNRLLAPFQHLDKLKTPRLTLATASPLFAVQRVSSA